MNGTPGFHKSIVPVDLVRAKLICPRFNFWDWKNNQLAMHLYVTIEATILIALVLILLKTYEFQVSLFLNQILDCIPTDLFSHMLVDSTVEVVRFINWTLLCIKTEKQNLCKVFSLKKTSSFRYEQQTLQCLQHTVPWWLAAFYKIQYTSLI